MTYVLKIAFSPESETEGKAAAMTTFKDVGWNYQKELDRFELEEKYSYETITKLQKQITRFLMKGFKVSLVKLCVVQTIFSLQNKY